MAAIVLISCLYFHHNHNKEASHKDHHHDFKEDSKYHSRSASPRTATAAAVHQGLEAQMKVRRKRRMGYVEEQTVDSPELQQKYEGEKEEVTTVSVLSSQ